MEMLSADAAIPKLGNTGFEGVVLAEGPVGAEPKENAGGAFS